MKSPVFVHVRLQLLNVGEPHHSPQLKDLYGILMLLLQSNAFILLNNRLVTMCNLRDHLRVDDRDGLEAKVVMSD